MLGEERPADEPAQVCREQVVTKARERHLAGADGSARVLVALEDRHLPSGSGEYHCGHKAVVARTYDDGVTRLAHGPGTTTSTSAHWPP